VNTKTVTDAHKPVKFVIQPLICWGPVTRSVANFSCSPIQKHEVLFHGQNCLDDVKQDSLSVGAAQACVLTRITLPCCLRSFTCFPVNYKKMYSQWSNTWTANHTII